MVPLFEGNPTELPLIFTLDFIYQRHHHRPESWNLIFVQLPYLQRYADAVAGTVLPFYNCFGFFHRAIARIFSRKGRHARVHGVKFQIVVLPNGLIINVEG